MNKLYNGDCLEVMDRLIEEGVVVDAIITSPPYDDMRNYNNTLDWNFDKFKKIANKLKEILIEGGVLVWIVNDKTTKGNESLSSFKQALYFQEIGLNIHDTMIWKKKNPFNFGSNNCYIQSFEYMFVISKGKPKSLNLIYDRENKTINEGKIVKQQRRTRNGDFMETEKDKFTTLKKIGKRYNVWEIKGATKVGTHTATFPIEIPTDHIMSWTDENQIVLDPFMGSGTTGVACKNLNRNFIGIEMDKKYFEIAESRIYDLEFLK